MPRPPTITFKQFLESNEPLQDMERAMIIRQLIPSLKTAEALKVLDWVEASHAGPATYDDLPDEIAEKVAQSEFAQTDINGKDLHMLPDHKAAPIIRGKIQSMMWDMLNGMKLKEEAEPLMLTQIEMFFRKELDLPALEASEGALWVTGEKDWLDLEGDTRDHVLDYVQHTVPNIYDQPSWKIQENAMTVITDVMYKKYGVEL